MTDQGTVRGGRRTGLVDWHAHFLPAWPAWSLNEHLALMDRVGIARSVLSLSSPGLVLGAGATVRRAREVNDAAGAIVDAHPDRFSFLASIPLPDVPAAVAEWRRGRDLGALGVVILTNVDGRYPGDPESVPLWEKLEDSGAIVLLHPTSPPGWQRTSPGQPRPLLEFPVETTRAVLGMLSAGVLMRHPRLQLIAPHCGGLLAGIADRAEMFARAVGAPSFLDQLPRLWYDLAGNPTPHNAAAIAELAGADRLVYGSDACFTPPQLIEAQLAALDVSTEPWGGGDWRDVVGANSDRLLAGRGA